MRTRRAFSLIEILVACSVAGVVLIAVVGIFGGAVHQWNSQTGLAESMQEANLAADVMAAEIGCGTTWSSNVLTLPASTDSSGNYIQTAPLLGLGTPSYTAGTQVQYYLSNVSGTSSNGNCLCREYTSGLLNLWTVDTVWGTLPGGVSSGAKYPNVTALSFSTGSVSNFVQLSVTIGTPLNGHVYSYTATRNVYLSNHN